MRMKTISVLMVGMVLVADVSAQEERKTIPDIGQVRYITLETSPTLWLGAFHTNGAARIVWRGGNDAAATPKGSFSFEDIYNTLVPRLEQDGATNRDMRVVLYGLRYTGKRPLEELRGTRRSPEEDLCYTGYLRSTKENKEIARTLMSSLRDMSIPREKEAFEARLRDYPLVKGDKPVARVYRKDLDDTASRAALEDIFWEGCPEIAKAWLKATRDSIGMPGDVSPEEQEAYLRKRMKETREEKGLAAIPPEEEERTIAEELARWKFFCEQLKEPPVKLIAGEVTVVEAGQGEGAAQISPLSRLYLYGGILAALCIGTVFWLILRKKGSPS